MTGLPSRTCNISWRADDSFAMWRPGHQVYVEFVELLGINIKLHIGQSQVGWNLGCGVPEDRLAVTGSMIDVDVHVELLLSGDDGWIDQGHASDFVPHVAGQRISIQILRFRRPCLGDR